MLSPRIDSRDDDTKDAFGGFGNQKKGPKVPLFVSVKRKPCGCPLRNKKRPEEGTRTAGANTGGSNRGNGISSDVVKLRKKGNARWKIPAKMPGQEKLKGQ